MQTPDTSATAARRSPNLLLCLLLALLVIATYSNVLFQRRNFGGRDLRGYHLPIEKAVHDAYRLGSLPVWIDGIIDDRADPLEVRLLKVGSSGRGGATHETKRQ